MMHLVAKGDITSYRIIENKKNAKNKNKVSREEIKKAFTKQEKFLQGQIPKTSLTKKETKQIYEARKAIENGVIMILVEKHRNNELDLSTIDSLVIKEQHLHENSEHAKLTRLSCDFHLTLAELCDNKFLVDSLKPLIPLSALAASVYADTESNFCSFSEHYELIEAI